MSKYINTFPKLRHRMTEGITNSTPLNLHELQVWVHGIEPKELESFTPTCTSEQVRAYMLAHQHFLKAVNDILSDRENKGQSSYMEIYDNLLAFCADRSEVSARWRYFQQPSKK